MALDRCIADLVETGVITPQRGRMVSAKYDELIGYYRAQMGDAAAAAQATIKTVEVLAHEAALRQRRDMLAVATQRRMADDTGKFRGKGPKGVMAPRAAAAILVRDENAPYLNVEYLWRAIRGRAHATMDQVLLRHRNDLLGRTRNPSDLDAVIDEAHGTGTGDLNAVELADGWRKATEMLRRRANAAGADIGKLDDWGLPHNHDSRRVGDAGFEIWSGFIKPLLNRERMIDRSTGLPFTDAALDEVLGDVFRTIETDGWSKRTPGAMGASALANRLGEHRFLQFKDGAAWRAYHERFGQGTVYDVMMNHIDRVSRDVALMEVLGPNPVAGLKWLQDSVQKSAFERGDRAARDASGKAAKKLQALFDEITGKNRQPYDRRIAMAGSAVRSWQVATKLGSAALSATSDLATQQLTRAYNGLPQVRTLSSYLKYMNPLDAADRAHAIRSGLIAEDYANGASTQGRYLSEELVGEIPRRVAESVLRVSGLNALTQGGRWAFGMDAISGLTHNSPKSFDALDPAFRRMLERYGMGAAEWDTIRATPLVEERGAQWLQPLNIADTRLGDRVMAMIQTEMDFAVPVGGVEISAAVNGIFNSGTILGELGRSAFQFKSFPVTITMMHAQRMMAATGWQGRVGYVAALMILTSVAGAMALQMKEIAKGKDPRPMTDWQFWAAASAQGGGAGIYGDFLKSGESRFGQSFTDVLKGPAFQTIDTLNDLTLGAAYAAADDARKVNYGARAMRALRSEVPGGSLWYLRLASERVLLDQLQSQIDPNYRQSWRRMEKRARDAGQDYYWEPGETAPDRSPDFEAMFEGDQP